jgi:hypothetical protein
VNRATRNAQVDLVDGNEAGKFLREILSLKDEIIAHGKMPLLVGHSASTFGTESAKAVHFAAAEPGAAHILTQRDQVDACRMHGVATPSKPAAAVGWRWPSLSSRHHYLVAK